ncbi:retrovirus-related pol polyprotein LINE-1 [Tanacetum coccineum]
MVAGRLKENVVRVTRRNNRIMTISVVIDGETINVISAYALGMGLSDADKKRFWDALDELVRECPTDQRLFIRGDLNVHIGAAADGYAGVQGGFGLGNKNEEGRIILEFATAYDLAVANSFFMKSDAHLITFQSGGEACSSRHRLVIVDVPFKKQRHRRETTERPRILWKNLKGEVVEIFKATVFEKLSALEEDMSAGNADQMWNILAGVIRDAAKDSLGVASESSRTYSTHRESWWFSEEVQTVIGTKKSRFKELLSCRDGNQEDIDWLRRGIKLLKGKRK